MFTESWALEYFHFVAPSLDHSTFLLEAKRDLLSRICFLKRNDSTTWSLALIPFENAWKIVEVFITQTAMFH